MFRSLINDEWVRRITWKLAHSSLTPSWPILKDAVAAWDAKYV